MPLAIVDLPGHQKHTPPPLHHAQQALIVLVNAAFKRYRLTQALANAVPRAARAYLYESCRSIAHSTSDKASRPAKPLEALAHLVLALARTMKDV